LVSLVLLLLPLDLDWWIAAALLQPLQLLSC
jgi:hypothetical protein